MRHSIETQRMNIVLDTDRQEILITQKWKFDWRKKWKHILYEGWNQQLTDRFRTEAFDTVNRLWSNKAYVTVTGSSNFAQAYSGLRFTIRIRLEEVSTGEHWKVKVYKTPVSQLQGAYVLWRSRIIRLTSEDIRNNPQTILNDDNRAVGLTRQYGVAHEFGHALGNVKAFGTGDEYHSDATFFSDFDSIMNKGNEVRSRHYGYIKETLERTIPDTVFNVSVI